MTSSTQTRRLDAARRTVLVVEDDADARDLIASILEDAGYDVLSAANGREALSRLHDCEGRCDLILNTPQGSGARADGYLIREAALAARVPCITTISGAAAAVHAIANARAETALSLQERIGT